MRSLFVVVLLLFGFHTLGAAEKQVAGIPDIDARAVMEDLKRRDTGGIFSLRAKPIIPPAGQAARVINPQPVSASSTSTASPGTAAPRPVQEKREGELFRPVISVQQQPVSNPSLVVPQAPASVVRVYRNPSSPSFSSLPMVRYSSSEVPQSYITAYPSSFSSYHLEDGSLSRAFYTCSGNHPSWIEVKLKPDEALAYYPGEGQKILFSRVEEVPTDGGLCTWNGSQGFLKFGSLSGLDGNKEVALAYKTGHQEVTVKRARITVLLPNVNK